MKEDATQNEEIIDMLQYVVKTVGGIETDVSELKTDVSELKTDVSELKTDVSHLKTDVSRLQIQMTNVEEKAELLDERVGVIYNNLDSDAKAVADNEIEIASAHHKLDRHDGWIHLLADKVGTKLKA